MRSGVLGLGTAAMDIVLECGKLPRDDGFAFIRRERLVPGGSCTNVLAALRQLGVPARLAAKRGDDRYGRLLHEDLEHNGIDVGSVVVKPGGTTLHTYVTVAPDGAKAVFAHLGDSLLELAEDEVGPETLDGIAVFYTDMFPTAPALKLARMCRDTNVKVVFNLQTPVSFMEQCGMKRRDVEEMIPLADVFIAGRESLLELAGTGNPLDGAHKVLETHGPRDGVIVTLGGEGAAWVGREETVEQPSFPVCAVDTTGAGDAFSAGFIRSAYFDGQSRGRTLRFACGCAALACTQPGPRFKGNAAAVLGFMEGVSR